MTAAGYSTSIPSLISIFRSDRRTAGNRLPVAELARVPVRPATGNVSALRFHVLEHCLKVCAQRHVSFDLAQGDVRLQGAMVDIDDETGRARSIVRVQERLPE